MSDDLRRPKFISSWLTVLKDDYDEGGVLKLVPWWLLLFVGIGTGVAFLISADFWSNQRWDVSTAVYSAILTINGLILALSWGAFSRIYASVCAPGFSNYLKSKGLLSEYIFYVGYVHLFQLIAICASAIGLFVLLVDLVPLLYQRIAFSAVVGLTAYSIKQAAGSVTVMNDLVWYWAVYEEEKDKLESKGNVVGLTDRQ